MGIETYEQAVSFWNSRINYEKAGMPQDIRVLKLDRMRLLLRLLENPHEQFKIIHVTGTKGKGSTSTILASILKAAGYRTGLYTSPHLIEVEERVQIDGVYITKVELTSCMKDVAHACEQVEQQGESAPTFFEIITAVGFLHFARQHVDWAVFEVGLGGRFDATNVCAPAVAVITSISLDHTEQLGNTLEQIAHEKAGIIKPHRPVIVGNIAPGPLSVIEERARAQQAKLVCLGRDFHREWQPGLVSNSTWPHIRWHNERLQTDWLTLPLWGEHQADNAALALAVIHQLQQQKLTISREAVAEGLRNTTVPGRLEVMGRLPWLIIDCAHNVASIQVLTDWLKTVPATNRYLLFAVSKDKQIREILHLLMGRFTQVCFTRYSSSARGADPRYLLQLWHELGGTDGMAIDSVSQAWQHLKHQASSTDLLCATGSVFLAGEVRQCEVAPSRP